MDTTFDKPVEALEWTAHPLRESPVKAVIASMIVLACGLLVALSIPDVLGGVLAGGAAMIFLFFMCNRFFLPSSYRMDENGIAVRYPVGTRSLRWKELRRFPHDQSGGYLSTRLRGGMFDSRGISVLFAGRGVEIIPRIQACIERAERADS